jgi:preprotein translocase subunit SecG
MLNLILVVLHVIASLMLVLFILLHSGRGTGLSDVFGGGSGGLGATGAIEKNLNLDRITIAAAIVFGLTTILLGLRLSS